MMLTSQDLNLWTRAYDEHMKQEFEKPGLVHQSIFTEVTDRTKQFLYNEISGLGEWGETTEGAQINKEDPVAGYQKTFTQVKRTNSFEVSFEAVDMDESALVDGIGTAKAMGFGANATIEKSTAAVLIDGFTTTGPDGQYLWDTDHPKNPDETGTTYDNLLSGAFSHNNLEAAETQISANFFNPKGLPIRPGRALLVFPPALRGAVSRVMNERATERPGTTERDINRFAVKNVGGQLDYTLVEWDYLGAALGGSDTAWYIIFPDLHCLRLIWSQKPEFSNYIDHNTETYVFKGRMLYDVGAVNWRAGFASTGL